MDAASLTIEIFIALMCAINLLLAIFHIIGRTRLCLAAMKYAADTPRGKASKTTRDWFKWSNLCNICYTKYDHLIAAFSSLAFLINLTISILALLFETTLLLHQHQDDNSSSTIYNENSTPIVDNGHCLLYVRSMALLFLLSKMSQYSYFSILIYNATRDSMFEVRIQRLLKMLWTLLLIIFVYLIGIEFAFEFAFDRNSAHFTEDGLCMFTPPIISWLSLVLIDIAISVFLLYLLIKPLYIAAAEVHERMTSLRDDPLHQLMWKYITLVSPMAVASFLIMMLNSVRNFGYSFTYFLVLLLFIVNICTFYLFRQTEGLIRACFKCLDCWIRCNDTFCCCCSCYSKWLKQDVEFSNASHEFSKSLSKETKEKAMTSDTEQELDEHEAGDVRSRAMDQQQASHTLSVSMARTPSKGSTAAGSVFVSGVGGESVTSPVSSPQHVSTDTHSHSMPPVLEFHMRQFSSYYSRRAIYGGSVSAKSPSQRSSLKRVKSKNNESKSSKEIPPAVDESRQNSVVTHIKLKQDLSSLGFDDALEEDEELDDDEREEHEKHVAASDLHGDEQEDEDLPDTQIEPTKSLSEIKSEHIQKLSTQMFGSLHDKTTSIHDAKLEDYLDKNILSERHKQQYLNRTSKSRTSQELVNALQVAPKKESGKDQAEDTDAGDIALQLTDTEVDGILDTVKEEDGEEEKEPEAHAQGTVVVSGQGDEHDSSQEV